MTESTPSDNGAVLASFDSLARLDQGGWNHNQHYHTFLLKHLPTRMEAVLDIGCGTGDFARILAARAGRVLGVDFSSEMIRQARARSDGFPNITYVTADIADYSLPPDCFDAIVSITAFHHLPSAAILKKAAAALKPGGTLAILDLCRPDGILDHLLGLLALPVGRMLQLVNTGRLSAPPEVRALWRAHSELDRPATVSAVRATADDIIAGAHICRHLLWRYSLVWRKPCR